MDFERLMSQVTDVLRAARARVAAAFPLGITARLSISLAAVAVLGAAANMIAQESVSIIRVRIPAPDFQAPVPAPVPVAVPVPRQADPPGAPPADAVHAAAPDNASIVAMRLAVERFERASHLRADISSAGNEEEFLSASGALRISPAVSAGSALAKLAADYRTRGQSLIHAADERRAARAEHSRHLQSINERMQQSLDRGLKIFGRVLARQSLLKLRAQLDDIRRHSEIIVAGDALNAEDIDLLAGSENAFAATLAANQKSLEKSEGEPWVRGIREDFDALVELRASLYSLDNRFDDEDRRFAGAHTLLAAAITAAAARATPRAVPPPVPIRQPQPLQALAAQQPAAPNPTAPGGATAPGATAPGATAPAEVSEPAGAPRSNRARNLMAVTAIVIMFIAAISIATVRAVLTPVRRILRATARVAKGDMQVRVPRGGIRELDTLAGAFNEMALKLAEAQAFSRSQQESLEETVLQRTHKLQQLAQQDPLTSLPNRRHLSTLLNAAIERANREKCFLGVYFIDIDNFKNFNDSLGHVFGDRVLMSVANRLEEIADGLGFVARLGGDEFTFVYECAPSLEAIQTAGWDLVHAFQKLVSVDDREFSISTSVGASVFPEHGRDAEVLLRAADSALFRAKELGRGQLALFTPELTETAASRFSIEQGLRRALENSEFELAYQPEINLADSQVGIVEALLRWRMPDGRLAKPGEFLAVAEQSGLIAEINDWVLRTALRDASRWHHGGWPDARVAVNISARQLLDQRFVEQVLALTLEYRLPPGCIELELTEMVLQTGAGTIAALRALQAAGFGIALDDFGTGYSSLTSLEQLPLSRIKLDRSLIAGIDTSARSAAIARAIIDLCEGLELPVTAEGIERPEQFAWLMGCRNMYLQGYLLSDAVPFGELLQLKASLSDKIQDLLLSLPAPAARRRPALLPAVGSVSR